ncbi:hypothetical protein HOD29_04285 [archaeon]|jgi:hypothetical protein|nr:hypothetical protein [archaeon]
MKNEKIVSNFYNFKKCRNFGLPVKHVGDVRLRYLDPICYGPHIFPSEENVKERLIENKSVDSSNVEIDSYIFKKESEFDFYYLERMFKFSKSNILKKDGVDFWFEDIMCFDNKIHPHRKKGILKFGDLDLIFHFGGIKERYFDWEKFKYDLPKNKSYYNEFVFQGFEINSSRDTKLNLRDKFLAKRFMKKIDFSHVHPINRT